jgi:hypothetical protein
MATCPTCHGGGGNWCYCQACQRYWCANCERKKGWSTANKCPYCGTVGKVVKKEPG